MFRSLFAVALLAAPAAHAWEVVAKISIQVFGETTVRMLGASSQASSEASTHGSRGDQQAGQAEQAEQAEPAPGAPSGPADANDPPPPPRWTDPAPAGSPPPPPPPPPQPALDSNDATKQTEERPMMLWRKSTEVYLREHASQLKQDVALGGGPVVAALASFERVPPAKLGQLMRANHHELLSLIGDPQNTEWPERFLKRVDVLHSSKRGT